MGAGAVQDMQGHPDNKQGAGQLPIDAVAALAQADPAFPWADYDIEDQGDVDGDGNFNEPDGILDHVVLVHAGEDKSGGGGAEGANAIWAHSSTVTNGATVPGTSLKISNYIVQPEDSGVGVFAHEYGHDLGLPDLYDTASGGDSDVDFWDLMSPALTRARSSSRCRLTWACGTSGSSAGPTRSSSSRAPARTPAP